MLRDHGLLTLRPGVAVTHAGLRDIVENPHRFQFKEVDQMMLQRAFEDVDLGFLFSAYAQQLGFTTHDALALESVDDSPYKGIVAVRAELVGTPKIKALENAYESQAMKAFFRRRYGDAIVFLDRFNHPVAERDDAPSAATPSPAGQSSPTLGQSGWDGLVGDIVRAWPEVVQAIGQTLYMLVITIRWRCCWGRRSEPCCT